MTFKNKQPLLQTSHAGHNFKSNGTLTTYQVFHQLNCKSSYIIHLNCQMEYVEKSGTKFNIKLNNHTKDLPRKDSMFLITRGSATENLSWKFWLGNIFIRDIYCNEHFFCLRSKDILIGKSRLMWYFLQVFCFLLQSFQLVQKETL